MRFACVVISYCSDLPAARKPWQQLCSPPNSCSCRVCGLLRQPLICNCDFSGKKSVTRPLTGVYTSVRLVAQLKAPESQCPETQPPAPQSSQTLTVDGAPDNAGKPAPKGARELIAGGVRQTRPSAPPMGPPSPRPAATPPDGTTDVAGELAAGGAADGGHGARA